MSGLLVSLLLLDGLLGDVLAGFPLDIGSGNLGSFSGLGDLERNAQGFVIEEIVLVEMEVDREIEWLLSIL